MYRGFGDEQFAVMAGAIEYIIVKTSPAVFDERVHLCSTTLQYKLLSI